MNRVDYFKVFAFLAFANSTFLSTFFHYPVFTVFWFVAMILFMVALSTESSELTILALTALAYIPLGLIYALSGLANQTNYNNNVSQFAWLLVFFVIIEFALAIAWICRNSN